MNEKKLIGLICIFLIISFPLSIAQNDQEPQIKDEDGNTASVPVGAGELDIGLTIPESTEEFKEESFPSDILLNVNRYEPTVLTTNLVEEQNTPVYAFLSAVPSINLGEVPRIENINFAVIGGDTQYIAGTPQHTPPPVYTYEDIGYITTFIKRIPEEQAVPKKVDVSLKARIRFQGEVTAPVIGGEERKLLEDTRSRRIFSEDRFIDPRFQIFSGRGYIRPSFIGDNFAIFDIYGQDGVRIRNIRAPVGQESESVNLIPGSQFVENEVRVRVERIISEADTNLKLKIEGEEQVYNIGNEITIGDTGTGWFIEDIFIPEEENGASFVYLVRSDGNFIDRTISSFSSQEEFILVFRDNKNLEEGELLNWYLDVYQNKDDLRRLNDATPLDLKEKTGIFSQQAARFVLNRLPVIEEDEIEETVIENIIDDLKTSFDFKEENDEEFPKITDINEGKDTEAEFRIRGTTFTFREGDILDDPRFDSCEDRSGEEQYCEIDDIGKDSVTISYPIIDRDGECGSRRRERLELNSEFETEARTTTVTREQGSQDIAPSSSITQTGDTLSRERCGIPIELVDIKTNRQVEVTILAGKKRGYTESIVNLHIPIEKRAINISIDKLDEKIEETQKLIEELDDLIEKLESFVSVWSKVCLGVSAWFTLEAFLVGLPKYKQGTGPADTTYTKDFNTDPLTGETYYTTNPKNLEALPSNNQIHRIEDGAFIGPDNKVLNEKFAYSSEGHQFVWDPIKGQFEPAPSLTGADSRAIRIYSGEGGKNKIVVGVNSKKEAVKLVRQIGNPSLARELENTLDSYSDNGYYFVYDQGESVTLWQKRGNELDFQERAISGELDDVAINFFFKTGGSNTQRFLYTRFANQFDNVREAQVRGQGRARFGESSYNINNMGRLNTAKYRCEDVLGSEAKCSILYNACDPVVCPRSRCNLGGHYTMTGPSGVIGSGLVGSLVLCLPNIKKENGGVLVPICLSGILASLKGIRSHLESYKQCLEKQKANGVVEGTCDKLRSIFLCQLIWREGLTLLQAKSGLINLFNGQAAGGGDEYFTQGIGGSVEEANEVLGFLVNDYADDVLAAYRGKGLAEIGVDICKASIAQRIPFLDSLVQEFATPANPPQFTAYFEEASYAPTLGKSQYSAYFHIYAGTPQREQQALSYFVYLKSFGSNPRLIIDSGSLPSEQSADKTIDLIGDAGYQEICVVLNGLEQCGFGRVVSSSFLISGLDDYLASVDLARDITTAAQCKADVTAPVTYTAQTGTLPFARVRRVCTTTNPGLGLGEENSWKRVGSCGSNQQGISLGFCWEFGDINRYPETARLAVDLSCRSGEVCEPHQACTGETMREANKRVCCVKGTCEDDQAISFARSQLENADLSQSDINKLEQEVSSNRIYEGLTNEEYFAKGILFLEAGRPNTAITEFSKIEQSHSLFPTSRLILAELFTRSDKVTQDIDKARRYLNAAKDSSDLIDENEKEDFNIRVTELEIIIKEKEEEKQNREEKLKREDKLKEKADKAVDETSKLIITFSKFNSIQSKLSSIRGRLTTIRNNMLDEDEETKEKLANKFGEINQFFEEINVETDEEYTSIKRSMENWVEELNNIQEKSQEEKSRTIQSVITKVNNLKKEIEKWKVDEPKKQIIDRLTRTKRELDKGNNELAVSKIEEAKELLPKLQDPINNLKTEIQELKDEINSDENSSG